MSFEHVTIHRLQEIVAMVDEVAKAGEVVSRITLEKTGLKFEAMSPKSAKAVWRATWAEISGGYITALRKQIEGMVAAANAANDADKLREIES